MLIVDGTLVPTRDHTVAEQSKNYRYTTNHQVVIDTDNRLVLAVGRPSPGNHNDRKAWELSGAKDAVGRATVIADGGYRGNGLIIPHRREPGQTELPAWKEAWTAAKVSLSPHHQPQRSIASTQLAAVSVSVLPHLTIGPVSSKPARTVHQRCEDPLNIISRVNPIADSVRLDHMAGVLECLQRREFIGYLQEFVSNAAMLETVAGRSSIHANGFTKLVLERHSGIALRLHIWEPGERDAELLQTENIHDHVWPFASRVLIGGLHEERFDFSRAGPLMDHYQYVRGRATLPPGNLVLDGQARLDMLADLSHSAGNVYEVDNTVLHRARIIGDAECTATLVMTGRPRVTPASVYAPTGVNVREDLRESRLSADSVLGLLEIVIEALK
ncbi:hypothetical protein GCM10017557_16950 [Streptomyces aurantiacus]|uniref:Transposase IS4-like domain-containing protein n=1 Tax=Streptomyces aurantiacus TaxID=47760 RepID=A0A7G1NZ71_9ACTN|nr:hypothetical protein GCM10017557_16950 [Streptomyces aurantiacus]